MGCRARPLTKAWAPMSGEVGERSLKEGLR